MNHELKTHEGPFQSVRIGQKTFEYRLNDRDYKPGDTVTLLEYLPTLKAYTGDLITAKIGFCLYGPSFGVPEGYCCFSLLDVKLTTGRP
jgi:ParB family chromosome partitioning protein